LLNLKLQDVETIAQCWLSSREAAAFAKEFNRVFSTAESSMTPLLATITVAVYRKLKRLPPSRTRLYEIFTDLLCGGWDMAKGVMRHTLFSREQQLGFLSQLAYSLQRSGKRYFKRNDALNAITWYRLEDLKTNIDELLGELLSRSLLTRSAASFQFRHLSFQEYFAARFCLRQPDDASIRNAIVEFVDGDEKWHEVIRFYFGMCDPSRELHAWINTFDAGSRRHVLNEMIFSASRGVNGS